MKSKIYEKYKEYYEDYLNKIGVYYYGDREIRRLIMGELGGCINGDETMVYYTPDKKYKFIIYRTEIYTNNYYDDYRITIEVYDGIIGNPIMSMNFNTFTCVDILFNIAVTPDILIESQDTNCIYINPDTSSLNGYMIMVTSIFGVNVSSEIGSNSPMYNVVDSMNNIYEKDVRLDIFERSYKYDNVIPMISMDLTYDELSDFAFHVFFATIIDLEFPEECRDKLEQIEMFVSNYQIYKLQNQNI